MLLISFWQVLMFLIAFWSLKQAKNEGELGIIHGKARLKLNCMKNPSFGELQSLCQINQVCKEENQRKNLTLKNFATTCEIFAATCKIFVATFSLAKFSHLLFHLRNFRISFFTCEIFASLFTCEIFASPLQHYENFATPFPIVKFRSSISQLQNLHVIFRYFALTPLDFYLTIFCVIIYSLLVISWRSFKIFRISIWRVENISLYIYEDISL